MRGFSRGPAAVFTVLGIMVARAAPPSVRVRAADSVPGHALAAIEIEDVEIRVAALEQAAELSKSNGNHWREPGDLPCENSASGG